MSGHVLAGTTSTALTNGPRISAVSHAFSPAGIALHHGKFALRRAAYIRRKLFDCRVLVT